MSDKTVEAFIITLSGQGFVFEHPDPEAIVIEDIAHALSHICRYTGHTREFYSVAEHSIRVSKMVEEKYGRAYALEGLMHDASEAYITDVSKPLKMLLGEPYKRLETIAMGVIASKFGFRAEKSEPVAYCDGALYLAERRDLFGEIKPTFTLTHHVEKTACEDIIKPMTPSTAKSLFLLRFAEVQSWL